MFFITKKKKQSPIVSLIRYFSMVVGVVLIWRGIWHILDLIDDWLFEGNHIGSALLGVIIGVMIIYIPDYNFKKIENYE